MHPCRAENADSEMSPETLKEWPHKHRKRPKLSVTFNARVDVRRVSSHKEVSYLWYQSHEFQAIANELQQTIFHFRESIIGQAAGQGVFCLRGLEDYAFYDRQVSRERRMKAALIVLLEQDRQLDEDGPVVDQAKLAYCLKGISGRNSDRARRRAMNDEKVAARIFEKSGAQLKSFLTNSVNNMCFRVDIKHGRGITPMTFDSSQKNKLASLGGSYSPNSNREQHFL
jgi:hypothetical protein